MMSISSISTSPILIFLLSLFVSTQTFGLPDDKDQPINVSANKAQKNDNTGVTVYIGDVVITQGSIRMTGDKITIYDNNGNVEKIVAEGKPARFKQKPEPESEDVVATAATLEYELNKESLLLNEDAVLKQDGRTTNSNQIIYDMKTAIVNAGADNGRVNMTIQPSKTTE